MPDNPHDITHLLHDWKSGDERAINQLMGIVYDQLKLMAHRYTIKERADNTLNTTGLVHEAFLRIVNQQNSFENRSHFYAIVATCMRRVILEVARSKRAHKRGNNSHKVELRDHFLISSEDADQILAVNDALTQLEKIDPRAAQVVEMRYFGGMTTDEIADTLHCSPATVKRDWRLAKAWLQGVFEGNK